MYMYVNKRVELAQRGIALQKMYVLLLLLIYFTHINLLKAVHEGHINRSKIGNTFIGEIVTVFVTHTCTFFFFPVFDSF